MREYGVVESWNKLFVLPFDGLPYFIAFTEYGSLLTWCMNQALKTVLIENKTIQKKDRAIQLPSVVVTFMESLVLLDGANMVSY